MTNNIKYNFQISVIFDFMFLWATEKRLQGHRLSMTGFDQSPCVNVYNVPHIYYIIHIIKLFRNKTLQQPSNSNAFVVLIKTIDYTRQKSYIYLNLQSTQQMTRFLAGLQKSKFPQTKFKKIKNKFTRSWFVYILNSINTY